MALGAGGGLDSMYMKKRFGEPQVDETNTNNAYRSAITTQAGNYDEIMQGYRNQLNSGNGGYDDLINQYKSLLGGMGNSPEDVRYQESDEQRTAFKDLKGLVDTGGISEGEAGDLRARGMSPIRAVYANMQRGMDRQRALGGGYSPSYNASATRMARESSEQIAGATQNVNAKIAEMRQQGKLSAAPEYAKLADSKTRGMNEVNLANQRNKADFAGNKGQLLSGYGAALGNKNNQPLEALRGMTSLYGTTPALVNTFGGQVANQSGQNQNAESIRKNYKMRGL